MHQLVEDGSQTLSVSEFQLRGENCRAFSMIARADLKIQLVSGFESAPVGNGHLDPAMRSQAFRHHEPRQYNCRDDRMLTIGPPGSE